jgi:hypothetical protein
LTQPNIERRNAMIAAALILVATTAGWFAMPKIMLLVSGGGPFVGLAVAILFMLSFFAVLWLRARYQRRTERD